MQRSRFFGMRYNITKSFHSRCRKIILGISQCSRNKNQRQDAWLDNRFDHGEKIIIE